jgi:Ca-activated chloride channel homolog
MRRIPFAMHWAVACMLLPAAAQDAPKLARPTTRQVQIDLDKAVPIHIAQINADLSPTAFASADGRQGWVIRLPGNHPIATPAIADGVLFVGGGYGSHEFYAINAATGKVIWQMKTGDDGPSAAVVESGCVAFNTESCTIYILDATTGKGLWHEWLGDPLMSQPAIAGSHVYMAYPGGHPRGPVLGAQAPQSAPTDNVPASQVAAVPRQAGHRLLCADLQTGKHVWEQEITADVITAPVIDGDRVYLTCFDGTSFCLDADKGSIVWQKKNAGTSSPLVADGKVMVTERQTVAGQPQEGIRRLDAAGGKDVDKNLLAIGNAEYFKPGKEGSVTMSRGAQAAADAGVGFGGGGVASTLPAQSNVNVATVAGAWSYQGSRVAYNGASMLNGQANMFNCVSVQDGQLSWRAEARGQKIDGSVQLFSPPALGKKNLYICTAQGHLLAMDQSDGSLKFAYSTSLPMAFQPALWNGSMYVGTTNGLLICFKTNDPDADGWSAWGGNAQHNKKP